MDAIILNGMPVDVAAQESLLEVAARRGVVVPTLCHHPSLSVTGRCKVCLVEADGKLVPACATRAVPGMRVETDNARVLTARRRRVEALMRHHRGECASCRQREFCGLLELAAAVGLGAVEFREAPLSPPVQSGALVIDLGKCLGCERCVRVCREVRRVDALRHPRFTHQSHAPVRFDPACEGCGQCAVVCPTGAIVEASRHPAERRVRTVCGYCGTGCSLYLDVREGRVTGVTSDPFDPVGGGNLCVKGRFGFGFIHHPERLRRPLLRSGAGFREVDWEQALEFAAGELGRIREAHGGRALAGLGSARGTNEENYAFQRLLRGALGSNNVDNCARL